jgi:hypothetical protein
MRTSLASSMLRRLLAHGLAAVVGLGLGLAATSAAAHAGSGRRIQAEVREGGAALRVEVEAVDAAVALGLRTSFDADDLLPHTALVQRWLGDGLRLEGEGGPCLGTASAPTLEGEAEAARLVVQLDYACPAPMGVVRLHDDTVLDGDAVHETFVSVRGLDGSSHAHVLRDDVRSVELISAERDSAEEGSAERDPAAERGSAEQGPAAAEGPADQDPAAEQGSAAWAPAGEWVWAA